MHQLLSHANDVNLLGDNVDTMKRNTETLIDASKKIGLEINICCHLITKMHVIIDIKIAIKSFENVSQFRYLRMTVTNQNLRRKLRGECILVMLATIQSEHLVFLSTAQNCKN
jgi:hypothetical protein